MEIFNVIVYDFNRNKFESYNIIPYLVRTYNEIDTHYNKIPVTFEEFKEFVRKEAMYQFWARCEYEIILVDWPSQKHEEKWDVYQQILMNLDLVTKLVMESI